MTHAHSSLPDLIKCDGRVRHPVYRAVLFASAVVCLLVGLVGVVLPVMPGVPFFIPGIVLLGMASERAAHWINSRERRLKPKWRVRLRKMLGRAKETRSAGAK